MRERKAKPLRERPPRCCLPYLRKVTTQGVLFGPEGQPHELQNTIKEIDGQIKQLKAARRVLVGLDTRGSGKEPSPGLREARRSEEACLRRDAQGGGSARPKESGADRENTCSCVDAWTRQRFRQGGRDDARGSRPK